MIHLYFMYSLITTRSSNPSQYSLRLLYSMAIQLSTSKSNVLYFSLTGINNYSLSWKLGQDTIKISKSFNHLGVLLEVGKLSLTQTKEQQKHAEKFNRRILLSKIVNTSIPHLFPSFTNGLYFLVFCTVVNYGVNLNRKTIALWTYFSISSVNTT